MRYFLLLQGMIRWKGFSKKKKRACGVWAVGRRENILWAVETNKDMVYRIALHDCRNRHDAEDIMQIVFLNCTAQRWHLKAGAFEELADTGDGE